MILVLCPNAALDKILVVDHLVRGRRHQPKAGLDLAGGKGVNAARALRKLGRKAKVLGFLAGHTGRHIDALCQAEGIPADWVWLPQGESRTCLTLVNKAPIPTEVNEQGPRVGKESLRRLEERFRRLLKGCRFALFCGRLPPGVPASFYARLIRIARSHGVPTALDTSEDALSAGLRAQPDLVKPNESELGDLGLPAGKRHWRASLERLCAMGAQEAFVTLGAEGALMKAGRRVIHAVGPRITGCPLGCGDTFLAAAVHGRLCGWLPERRLAFATAAATANVRVLGAGVFLDKHLKAALAQTRVHYVR